MMRKSALRRWAEYNAVGALGFVLQLAVLAALLRLAGIHYLAATALAVEAAVLHNFAWHQRWTWSDRAPANPRATLGRLVRFHLLNGGVSLAGNVGITGLLAGDMRLDPIVANVVAIAACSLVTFVAGNALVFRTAAVAALAVAATATVASAGPTPAAVSAWNAYQTEVDARYARTRPEGPFFVHDGAADGAGWREAARAGLVNMIPIRAPGIPDAQIHHWVGAVFVPGARLDDALERLRHKAGNEAAYYDDVLASRLLRREGDRVAVYLKLRRESVVTVTYNTEHAVEYRRLGRARASSRSVAMRIAELENAGTAAEREKADDEDHGFLWRLNAYWRYEQLADGVLIECESVSLSRKVPLLLRPVATPIVSRIARESLERTLRSLRALLTSRG